MHGTRCARAVTALLAVAVVGVSTGVATSVPAGAAAAGKSCTPTGQLLATPPDSVSDLTSVTALSRRDVWITGNDSLGTYPGVLRWDSKSVQTATAPTAILPGGSVPLATSFASDSEGWAVAATTARTMEFTQHWHGGRWTMTPVPVSPDPVNKLIFLNDVAAVSDADAWAVGELLKTGVEGTGFGRLGAVIERWNGTEWTIVPNPVADRVDTSLEAIDMRSATDAWAVGHQSDGSGGIVPLVEHFDGTAWSVTPTPPGNPPAGLHGVSATAANDVWAVGAQTMAGTTNTAVPFVEHFDGTAWKAVADLPDIGNASLLRVYASGPNDVWALAQDPAQTNTILHWDGTSWSTTTLPGPQEYGLVYAYKDLDGTGPGDVWAVGTEVNRTTVAFTPLVAHLSCGKD
jgi:hypothetical protein